MSFTYLITQLSTNAVSRARLELGDTVEGRGVLPGGANLQDEEIQYYLDASADVAQAYAALFSLLAAKWATQADYKLGPLSENYSQVSKAFAERAKTWESQSGAYQGASSVPLVKDDGYSDSIPFGNHLAKGISGEYGNR